MKDSFNPALSRDNSITISEETVDGVSFIRFKDNLTGSSKCIILP